MRKQLFFTIIVLFVVCITGLGCGSSSAQNVQREVIRLDEDGYLYYMDYTKDYYAPDVIDKLREGGSFADGSEHRAPHKT